MDFFFITSRIVPFLIRCKIDKHYFSGLTKIFRLQILFLESVGGKILYIKTWVGAKEFLHAKSVECTTLIRLPIHVRV